MDDLKTTIEEEGQPYLDEPIIKEVPVYCAVEPMTILQTVGHNRVKLNWKRYVNGKLVPR
jgi:hypothetical protein